MSSSTLLLLRLEGPLQSWGMRARWDVRDSEAEPTKSGVMGLLGCALGYPVGDAALEKELDRQLCLGVRVERPGDRLVDYHTVTGLLPTAEGKHKGKPGDPTTIISPRTYLQDAAFLATIAGPPNLLERCRDALTDPRWPVYLGRKCCPPSRPILDELADRYADMDDCLQHHPWSCQTMELQNRRPTTPLRCVVEDPEGQARRCDAVRANPARMYGFRNVRIFHVDPPEEKEDKSCT